jgi:large subunit ribosomal protein L24
MKLKKGDEVQVISGKDVGKRGEVTRVLRERDRVIVTGSGTQLINVAKKHQKPTRATMQGGIIDKEMPIHASNVAYVCKDCGPTRLGYRFGADGKKMRICKKCERDA